MPTEVIDMTGQTIGLWTVTGYAGRSPANHEARWDCVCACGATSVVRGGPLRNGTSQGCRACRVHGEYDVEVGYAGAHKRIARRLGPAAQHTCADCSGPAADWSYIKTSGWSENPADYTPRCVACHRRYDRSA